MLLIRLIAFRATILGSYIVSAHEGAEIIGCGADYIDDTRTGYHVYRTLMVTEPQDTPWVQRTITIYAVGDYAPPGGIMCPAAKGMPAVYLVDEGEAVP